MLDGIRAQDIVSAYSGHPGCACGCQGRYWYTPGHVAWAGDNRGFPIQPHEVGTRRVATILGRARRAVRLGAPVKVVPGRRTIVQVDAPDRTYIFVVSAGSTPPAACPHPASGC